MIKTLSAGAIGVQVESLEQGLDLAHRFGFGGLEFNLNEVHQMVTKLGAEAVRHLFDERDVVPVVFGLMVDWRSDESKWKDGLKQLEEWAPSAAAIGCHRTATWVMPGSNDLNFQDNLKFHIARFRPIAEVLEANQISLGLEFIGPKTLRATQRYPFIYTMDGMLEMASKIGPNVGLLLDSYHWHTSRAKPEEVHLLRPDQVVYVHLNDAIEGTPIDELMDGTRRLPGQTGVINLRGLIAALREIGFSGPVAVEPFWKGLEELPSDEERLRLVSESLSGTLSA